MKEDKKSNIENLLIKSDDPKFILDLIDWLSKYTIKKDTNTTFVVVSDNKPKMKEDKRFPCIYKTSSLYHVIKDQEEAEKFNSSHWNPTLVLSSPFEPEEIAKALTSAYQNGTACVESRLAYPDTTGQ